MVAITRHFNPTTDLPCRRVCRERRRVLDTEPDVKKRFIYTEYPCHRRVCRVFDNVSNHVGGDWQVTRLRLERGHTGFRPPSTQVAKVGSKLLRLVTAEVRENLF